MLGYLNFCYYYLGHVGKLMMAQTGKQIITIHIIPNIARSKGNQTTKFGLLIEYITRNTFLEKIIQMWWKH